MPGWPQKPFLSSIPWRAFMVSRTLNSFKRRGRHIVGAWNVQTNKGQEGRKERESGQMTEKNLLTWDISDDVQPGLFFQQRCGGIIHILYNSPIESMYNSVVFSIFTELYNHHHSIILQYFIIPKRDPIPISNHSPFPPSPIFLPSYLLLFLSSSSLSDIRYIHNHHHHVSPELFHHLELKFHAH